MWVMAVALKMDRSGWIEKDRNGERGGGGIEGGDRDR